ncbi:MAG TPA: biosynthetic peptidoglycan transglycosylase, partial [Phycisphaerae bacterium]|nr:biosynthetic peptidoglycan transglycosylase [Phycisphaerae bacterium]
MSTTPQPLRQIPRRKKWRRRFFRATIAAAIGIATLCAADQIAIRLLPFPDAKLPRPAALIEDRNGIELAAFVNPNDDFFFPLTSDEISPHLKKAIIAVEDRRFENHHGIDWLSAGAAALQDLRALSAKRGASTLSMQVARLRENQGHGWFDKPVQAFRAQQLELHESKDEILTEYINRAPFGGNLVGAGAASWRYFGKACRDLSLGQAALLAGLPQSPTRFRPDKSPDLARARRAHVLDQMLATAAITQDDYTRALNEPLDLRSSSSGLPGSPFSPPRAPG